MTIEQLIADIAFAENDLPKIKRSGTARAIVEREVDCDTNRLYGNILGAIAYLGEIKEKYPEAQLDEKWTGYETMYMRFAWSEPQTDEEYIGSLKSLLSHARYLRECRDEERESKKVKLLTEQKRIAAQLKELG